MAFLGLCILLSTCIAVDAVMFLRGFNSMFFKCKTDDEKAIMREIVRKGKGDA